MSLYPGSIITDSTGTKPWSDLRYASRMTLSKFERKEAKRAGVTVEHLREYHEITPCDCGKPKCKGWQVRYKFGAERKRGAQKA